MNKGNSHNFKVTLIRDENGHFLEGEYKCTYYKRKGALLRRRKMNLLQKKGGICQIKRGIYQIKTGALNDKGKGHVLEIH